MEKVNEPPEAPPTLHLAEEEAEEEEEVDSQEEIPILKAQQQPKQPSRRKRLGMSNVVVGLKKKKRQEGSKEESAATRGGSPDIAAPLLPQVNSVRNDEASSSSVSSYDTEPVEDDVDEGAEQEEDDEEGSVSSNPTQEASLESFLAGKVTETTTSARGCRQVVTLPRGRAVFYTDNDGKAIVPSIRQTSPPKKSLEPRRIIQSLFAKPKPLKTKKKKGLTKKARMALAKNKKSLSSSRSTAEGRRYVAAEDGEEEQEQNYEETNSKGIKKTLGGEKNGSSDEEFKEKDGQNESGDEKERTRTPKLRKRRRLYEENTDGWKKRRDEEERKSEDEEEPQQSAADGEDLADNTIERSEDEDEGMECEQPEGWKPMRAAMVAAMELVAKKQVTDDMRNERRIRKYNLKPMPPKGKGRRSIFKKQSKPVKSAADDDIPRVLDGLTCEGTFFHSGDILCLKKDLVEKRELRFYQARGFLASTRLGNSVSVLPLTRVVEQDDDAGIKVGVTSAKRFNPRHFKLEFEYGSALLNIDDVVLVQRCAHDFYHGHDVLFQDARPGYIYCRVPNPIIR